MNTYSKNNICTADTRVFINTVVLKSSAARWLIRRLHPCHLLHIPNWQFWSGWREDTVRRTFYDTTNQPVSTTKSGNQSNISKAQIKDWWGCIDECLSRCFVVPVNVWDSKLVPPRPTKIATKTALMFYLSKNGYRMGAWRGMFLSENKLASAKIHTEPERRKGGRAYFGKHC